MKIKAENVEVVLTLDHPFLNHILLMFNLRTCEKLSKKIGIPLTGAGFKYGNSEMKFTKYKSTAPDGSLPDHSFKRLVELVRLELNKANLENDLLTKEFSLYKQTL